MTLAVYVSGSGWFGAAAAETVLGAGHDVIGAASPPTRRGRDDNGDPAGWDRLRAWAYPRKVAWTAAAGLRARHVPDGCDLILSAHSHAFIGRTTRSRARWALGYHPSLLPLHRGRDAVRWTSRLGERVTGGTVYHLTDRVDGGPIAAQRHLIVPPGLRPADLWRDHLAPLGLELIGEVLADADYGTVSWWPQDDTLATWEPALDGAPLYRPELPELPCGGAR